MKERTKKWLYLIGEGCGRGAVICTVGAIVFFVAGLAAELARDINQRKELKLRKR